VDRSKDWILIENFFGRWKSLFAMSMEHIVGRVGPYPDYPFDGIDDELVDHRESSPSGRGGRLRGA
jgi:hypothetical protein